MNRRQIVKIAALAGAGTVAAPAAMAVGIPDVASRLSRYSRRVLPKALDGGTTHILASIDDLAAFSDLEVREKALPYDGIKASGNILEFSHNGREYRIEHVLPGDYAARASAL
ncbi:MAG: hypothetical protein R3F11_09735 [Verrucomicrobiales bacterium]